MRQEKSITTINGFIPRLGFLRAPPDNEHNAKFSKKANKNDTDRLLLFTVILSAHKGTQLMSFFSLWTRVSVKSDEQ